MGVALLEAADFTVQRVMKQKKKARIFVIFSTYGEREADLIYDKISLIASEAGQFIDGIFLSHRREEGDREERTEKKAREAFENVDILICNDLRVPDMGSEKGKGADMRRVLYYINKEYGGYDGGTVLVFLDADVVPQHFGTHFVFGLAGAVLQGFDFAKASFWREMGRVKKFVAQPLFSAIEHSKLKPLSDFHYPLSGEVAGTLDFFNAVHFWQIYGVETGINIDSCMGRYRVADVNLGLYDHEHHGDLNIQKMAFGIIRTYLKQLCDYGVISLNDDARLSDMFRASFIDENGSRQKLEFDLTEKKYPPLNELI